MKLILLAILFFAGVIVMPWQLMAPVLRDVATTHTDAPVAEAPLGDTGVDLAATPVAETDSKVEVQTKPITVVNPPAPTSTQKPATVTYTLEYTDQLEKAIHDRINVERVRAGLGILEYDTMLAQVAGAHSTDMAKENYFAHSDENGCTSSCRVTAAGYEWAMVGENLFLLKSTNRYSVDDAAAIIVAGWMGSEGHRHNLLEKDFTEEGLGIVILGDSLYATEVFARPK